MPNKQPNPEPSETGTNSLNAQRSSKKFTSICIPIARPDLLSQGGKGILYTHIYIWMGWERGTRLISVIMMMADLLGSLARWQLVKMAALALTAT